MKSVLIAVTLIVFFHTSGFAYQLTLEWDSNVEQDLAGYIVYYGTTSRNYKYDVDVGAETSCTISNLYSGVTYYFAVTAYDIDGNESPYSAEITYPSSNSAGSSSVSGGGGGGGGGCFISDAANGKNPLIRFFSIMIVLLIAAAASILYLRKRCPKTNPQSALR